MRKCFVPFCDSKNKDQPNRPMFFVPKKQTLFAQWAEVLPKVRTLRSTDKVCYLHFKSDDIISTFDHCINGQILKIQRDRPRLKPNALPCLEMTSEQELLSYRVKNRLSNNSKIIKNTNIIETDSIYEVINEDPNEKHNKQQLITKIHDEAPQATENCTIVIKFDESSYDDTEQQTQQTINNELETQKFDLIVDESSCEYQETNELNENNIDQDLYNTQLIDLFSLIYDKAYEVVTPNSLWGIHRCPNRLFVCFSYMDISKLQITKMLRIFDDASVQMIFNGNLVKNLQLLHDIVDLESLAVQLRQMDNWHLCYGTETNANCEVVVESSDGNCWSTENNEQVYFCKTCLQIS